jgi:hypothetical protein
MLSVAAAVVAIFTLLTAEPATAALPGYLGAFATARGELEASMLFLHTFDQHECSSNPTSFENKADFHPNVDPHKQIGRLKLNSAAIVSTTCHIGSDVGFENTPIDPGFNATNSDASALSNSADFLTTPQFTLPK